MLYPMLFKPIYKEMLWGGKRMTAYGRDLPFERTGESWDISCRPNEMSLIENGPLAGMPFDKAIAKDPAAFLGTAVHSSYERNGFPLLIKIIDANEDLSVQVHPDDAYAAAHKLESGKSEMWYIMEAAPGQSLIMGLSEGATAEKLRLDPMSCLKRLPVKKGDIINIPAGLVHAITKGLIVAEIQQNSDITFRLYDYERMGLDGKGRELHLDEGIAAVNFKGGHRRLPFTVQQYEVDGEIIESSNPEAFTIFTCVDGSCEISGVSLSCSRSAFIPAGLGSYNITGKAILLKSFV